MSDSQLSLFGDATPRPGRDSLFFAVQPDPDTASLIADLAARLRKQHGLRARPQAPGLMHVTLHYLGRHDGVPAEIVDRAGRALTGFASPAFRVCFDRVMSFRNPRELPLVLLGGEALAALRRFRGLLSTVLAQAQLPDVSGLAFNPHVTLLRDRREVPEQAVEPVCWEVRDFVLVRSLQGRGEHQVLARFSLRC